MAEQNRTPAAIVLAGLFIGAGLFFGLRDRRSLDSPPPSANPPGIASPGASLPASTAQAVLPAPGEPAAAQAAREPAALQVSREKATQQAKDAIEAHRAMLVETCWKPAAQGPDRPKPARFVFNISFDAQGNQIIRGIAEERGTGHPDVTACVTQRMPSLKIPPPGASAYVEVPFSLP